MKKLTALFIALVMMMAMTIPALAADETDSEYVKQKGTLVVGITDFAPMDYKDANPQRGCHCCRQCLHRGQPDYRRPPGSAPSPAPASLPKTFSWYIPPKFPLQWPNTSATHRICVF